MSNVINLMDLLKNITSEDSRSLSEKLGFSESVHESISKLRDEMVLENVPYINAIGDYLINHLNLNPSFSVYILNSEKSIKGSLNEMIKVAKSHSKDNSMACISDSDGFEVVLNYFKNTSTEDNSKQNL
ncbi:MAG: hypothetical protein Q8N88_04350 [Nanoarchaeota archaeon]|nr:hypothetical protein [Nanoarchaeota archaeon]